MRVEFHEGYGLWLLVVEVAVEKEVVV
jgi:hypothetical protein